MAEKIFHHEDHEEHEVLKKSCSLLFFVLFVVFVVKNWVAACRAIMPSVSFRGHDFRLHQLGTCEKFQKPTKWAAERDVQEIRCTPAFPNLFIRVF
jgi:hypothetical protein